MGGKRVKGKTGKGRPERRVTEEAAPKDERHIVWRFGRLHHAVPFGCQTLVAERAQDLERELCHFQDEPIYSLRRKGWLKFVRKSDMTRKGQQAVASASPQEDGLWQLHLHRDKWRIWGFFEAPNFFFLFWDPDHEIATGKSRKRSS